MICSTTQSSILGKNNDQSVTTKRTDDVIATSPTTVTDASLQGIPCSSSSSSSIFIIVVIGRFTTTPLSRENAAQRSRVISVTPSTFKILLGHPKQMPVTTRSFLLVGNLSNELTLSHTGADEPRKAYGQRFKYYPSVNEEEKVYNAMRHTIPCNHLSCDITQALHGAVLSAQLALDEFHRTRHSMVADDEPYVIPPPPHTHTHTHTHHSASH